MIFFWVRKVYSEFCVRVMKKSLWGDDIHREYGIKKIKKSMNTIISSFTNETLQELDRDIFEFELMCILLPVHGLSKKLPFSIEIAPEKKVKTTPSLYSFSVLTSTKQTITTISSIAHKKLLEQSKNFNTILKRVISVGRERQKKLRHKQMS